MLALEHGCPVPEQLLQDVDVPGLGGEVHGGGAAIRCQVRVYPPLQEEPDDVEVPLVGGDHEAGVVEVVGDVGAGGVVHQEADHLQVALEAGRPQGSGVELGPGKK